MPDDSTTPAAGKKGFEILIASLSNSGVSTGLTLD
jgi:hypothetical protein